jgi:hypothetical protein
MWDLRSGDDGRLGKKYFGGASQTYPPVLQIYRDTYLGFRSGCPELECSSWESTTLMLNSRSFSVPSVSLGRFGHFSELSLYPHNIAG